MKMAINIIPCQCHQRNLLLFADNAPVHIDTFSKEFEFGYLDILKCEFGTECAHANCVYQHSISAHHHLHMNGTRRETLTDFVKYLGKQGKCVTEEAEKGWYEQYKDPETISVQVALVRKQNNNKS
jgi:DNA/RNA-binding protein KIN17